MSLFGSILANQLGWLPAQNIKGVTVGGDYQIDAYGDPLTPGIPSIRAIKIPLQTPVEFRTATGTSLFATQLFFEFRRNVGFDFRTFRNIALAGGGNYTVPDVDGVVITALTPSNGVNLTHLIPVQLIPGVAYAPYEVADPYLRPGQVITVPGNGISIQVIAINKNATPNTLTLRVEYQ